MRTARGSSPRAPPPPPPPSPCPLPLSELEPFAVGVTVLSATFGLFGLWPGATPSLVLLCWFLLLLPGPGLGAGGRGDGSPTTVRSVLPWVPSLALAGAGWAVELLPALPLGAGVRGLVLAGLAGAGAYLLAPGDDRSPFHVRARVRRGRLA